MSEFTAEQIAEIRRIADEQIAGGVVVGPGGDSDIIAGPDELGRVEYRARPGTKIFDGELLRNGTVLTEDQRNNIIQNVVSDENGNLQSWGAASGLKLAPPVHESVDPRPWKKYPEYYYPAPNIREQRYGLKPYCFAYHWNGETWAQGPDALENTFAFRTPDTQMGVKLLKGL